MEEEGKNCGESKKMLKKKKKNLFSWTKMATMKYS